MKHQICVTVDFMNEERKSRILEAAKPGNFEVLFFDNDEAAVGHVAEAEVAYCITPAVPKAAPELRWCQTTYAGVGHYLEPGVLPADCLFTNGAGSYGVTISEHIIMEALMLLKRMPDYLEIVRNREWRHDLSIRSIYGSTVTIVGTGDIGKYTAMRLKGMAASKIIGVNRSGKCTEASFDNIVTSDRIDEVLPETDILVLCAPGTPETEGMITKERLALLPKHSILINVGRGTVLDQDALIAALNNEELAGAALDVVVPEPLPKDHPLWDAKNILITPHLAGNMTLDHTCDTSVDLFCRNLTHYINGEPMENVVNKELGY